MNQDRLEFIHKTLHNHILHDPTKLLVDELIQEFYRLYKVRYQEGYEYGHAQGYGDALTSVEGKLINAE